MVELRVYVSTDCWTCAESRRMVAEVAPRYPQAAISLIEIEEGGMPESVFAVPTFMLDGHVIALGNPYQEELCRKIEDALARESAT